MNITKCFSIPTLNDTLTDFSKLFELGNRVIEYRGDVIFELSTCQFLRPNAIAFLGGIARLIENRGRRASFNFNTAHDKVLAILRQNNFATCFGNPDFTGPGNSIPYKEIFAESTSDVKDDIIDYLTYEWLKHGWVHLSVRLRDAIVGRVWEIFDNALEHSRSSVGIFSCGQYFWRMELLKLAVVDLGCGIPANVRNYLGSHSSVAPRTSADCLEWAFQKGHSTSPGKTGRGMGLKLLKEFVNVNQGKLEIYSESGYALIENRKESFENLNTSFQGTLVNITLRCDESYYQFADEPSVGPLF